MTIPKENRQQMINLMYLVLTALLALNVSAEILNAFTVVNKSLDNSNVAMDQNNKGRFLTFQDRIVKEPDNKILAANMQKAKQVEAWSQSLDATVSKLIQDITTRAGGIDPETGEIKKRDDLSASTVIMVEGPKGKMNGEGFQLKEEIDTYKANLMALFDDPNIKKELASTLPLNTTPKTKANDWVRENFHQMPAIAAKTLLLKIQNDIKASQGDVINLLMLKTDEDIRIEAPVKFDQFSAEIMSPSSYVLRGEPLKVKLMLAATSSEAGRVRIVANGSSLVPGDKGYAEFNANTGAVGEQTISGYIELTKANGQKETHNFEPFKYTVALPFATVTPTKMNVFYIGVDNPVAASAAGVAAGDLKIGMSGGSITGSGGNYVVRVSTPGNAQVTVSDSKGRSFGTFPFRIKRIPDPVAKVGNKPGGTMSAAEFRVQTGLAAVLDNFDFDAKFAVLGYNMVFAAKRQDLAISSASGPYFTAPMKGFQAQAKPGDLVYFEEIRVKGPDGQTRKIPGITFKLQ